MKIIIIGYGKMGKEIEKICLKKNHEVLLKIDSKNAHLLNSENLKKCDLAIDFSEPKNVLKNIFLCLEEGVSVVSGTTGWDNQIDLAKKKCLDLNGVFLHAPNFSIGMNIFFELNSFLAKKINNYKAYKIDISESHHEEKKDKPSGTAIQLANDITGQIDALKDWSIHSTEKHILPINCNRKGAIKGIHEINYLSNVDKISIKHEAINREGFALGAVIAAEFIQNKKGIFTMKDVINSN